ncbi:MAG: phosphotransferase [Caldisericaceae bacterium]
MGTISIKEVYQDSYNRYFKKSKYNNIVSISRIKRVFGANTNCFIVKAVNEDGLSKNFFVKYPNLSTILQEIRGYKSLKDYITIPEVLYYDDKILINSYIEGQLLSELVIKRDFKRNNIDILKLEKNKENILSNLYKNSPEKILTFDKYLKIKANKLFYKRLFGRRYENFYGSTSSVHSLINKKIILNGHKFKKTIFEIFEDIKNEYKNAEKKEVTCILGHGDLHHGNIICTKSLKTYFIDLEYASFMPIYMELAKPYYNDSFVFVLLYHFGLLERYFSLKKFEITDSAIKIEASVKKSFRRRLQLASIKMKARSNILEKYSDFIRFNSYLVMSHTLNRDPNTFPEIMIPFFLIFTCILDEFDYKNPESILDYFK